LFVCIDTRGSVPTVRGTRVVDRIILSTVKHRNNADCQDERTEQKTVLAKRSPASVRQSPILSVFRSIVERRRRREKRRCQIGRHDCCNSGRHNAYRRRNRFLPEKLPGKKSPREKLRSSPRATLTWPSRHVAAAGMAHRLLATTATRAEVYSLLRVARQSDASLGKLSRKK